MVYLTYMPTKYGLYYMYYDLAISIFNEQNTCIIPNHIKQLPW